MRYKIGFEFPYFEQKFLLHGHSHFAFSGWVSHMLFVFLTLRMHKPKPVFTTLIWFNLFTAYGMLISFILQGYGMISIAFSSLSIIIGYVFGYAFYKSYNDFTDPARPWFLAGLLFNAISSLGTFYLAFMMAKHEIQQHAYLGSIYFYLHFQYSGWFFFTIMGLLISKLRTVEGFWYNPNMFKVFFLACFPAYFLSILWIDLPWYLFIFPVLSVILQLYGLYLLISFIYHNLKDIRMNWPILAQVLFTLAFVALLIKLLLQAGSVIPEVSKLAFGFRSIVIAYLHLVLLGFTSLFLLGYSVLFGFIKISFHSKLALYMFSFFVFANEFVLTLQGIASFGYIMIPYLNEILYFISLSLFLSITYVLLTIIQISKGKPLTLLGQRL
ncbi:MAG: hypothetical protein R2774_02840 [Saprospiraceae bacterium]